MAEVSLTYADVAQRGGSSRTRVTAILNGNLDNVSTDLLIRVDGGKSGQRRWARHGSARWLWKDQDVRQAIRYLVEQQGEPMAVFLGDVV